MPGQLYLPEMLLADGSGQSGRGRSGESRSGQGRLGEGRLGEGRSRHGRLGAAHSGVGLLVDEAGRVAGLIGREAAPAGTRIVEMPGKALLPGLANAHSHTFQRLFRGRAESRAAGGDTFWTWREEMYRAAAFVSPEDLYDVARATFLEMALAGITLVGEFHYLHRDRQGNAYQDRNLLGNQVIAAARSVGLRICLLRSAYFRAGFERSPHPGQARFYEGPDEYLSNLAELASSHRKTANVTIGAAPHSIRAVPLEHIKEIAATVVAMSSHDFDRSSEGLPLHLHISEQVAENAACVAEYGVTPVSLLERHGILTSKTTLIHAIHLTAMEFKAVADAGAVICCCPTTERNLGDGIFPADIAAEEGIAIAFGSDSQAQIDLLEDAREMEYHLRLRDQRRSVLDGGTPRRSDEERGDLLHCIERRLFESASRNGYAALGLKGGSLAAGEPADFLTVDLTDVSILGVDLESLPAQAVFSMAKSAVCDVAVQGRLIIQDRQHVEAEQIVSRYQAVQRRYKQFSK